MSTPSIITLSQARRVLEVVDAGLVKGLGVAEPGKMCVEAAVCFALGLPHGDNPPCVHDAVRRFKIRLNDAKWSSDAARTKGMRRLAIAQLGSTEIDGKKFVAILAKLTIQKLLPVVLRNAAEKQKNGIHKAAMKAAADVCEKEGTEQSARSAKIAANAANAAADATYAANAANAAYAATCAADAVTYAAANATYAGTYAATYAAHAAANATYAGTYAATDKYLTLSATLCVQALREVNAPGIALMDELIPEDDAEVS